MELELESDWTVVQVESGVKRFYLIDQMFFDSLFDLIQHYQSHPLR